MKWFQINNQKGFSTNFIGQNYDYPDGSYAEREEIVQRHREHQQGLMWTLANHPRIPEIVRNEVSRWGTCKDEFEREYGWQQQLYIREVRRLISSYVELRGQLTRDGQVWEYKLAQRELNRYHFELAFEK